MLFSKGFLIALGIIAAALLYAYFESSGMHYPRVASRDWNFAHLQEMRTALARYAEGNQGHLPPTLWTLIPKELSQERFAKLRFCGSDSGLQFDWLYFPIENIETLPQKTILLAAPGTSAGRPGSRTRMVWYSDHYAQVIPEADFQRLIREQNPPPVK